MPYARILGLGLFLHGLSVVVAQGTFQTAVVYHTVSTFPTIEATPFTITQLESIVTPWYPPEDCSTPSPRNSVLSTNTLSTGRTAIVEDGTTMQQAYYELNEWTYGCSSARTECCPTGWNDFGFYTTGQQIPGAYMWTATPEAREGVDVRWENFRTLSVRVICPRYESALMFGRMTTPTWKQQFHEMDTAQSTAVYTFGCIWADTTTTHADSTISYITNILHGAPVLVMDLLNEGGRSPDPKFTSTPRSSRSSSSSTSSSDSSSTSETSGGSEISPMPEKTGAPGETDSPEGSGEKGRLSTGAIAGIAVGVGLPVLLGLWYAAYRLGKRRGNEPIGGKAAGMPDYGIESDHGFGGVQSSQNVIGGIQS